MNKTDKIKYLADIEGFNHYSDVRLEDGKLQFSNEAEVKNILWVFVVGGEVTWVGNAHSYTDCVMVAHNDLTRDGCRARCRSNVINALNEGATVEVYIKELGEFYEKGNSNKEKHFIKNRLHPSWNYPKRLYW